MYNLRPFQQQAVDSIKEDFYSGINNVLLSLPTGCGKTVIFAALPDALEIGQRRGLFLAHTDELCQQAADKLAKCNPTRTVGIEKASSYAGNAQLVIASVQTLSRSPERLKSFPPDDFALLVTDECFVAGTLVDGRPIETLCVGDAVTSIDVDNKLYTRTITRLFKSKPSSPVLYSIFCGGREIVCTPEHPILTKCGWVCAKDVEKNTEVFIDELQLCSVRGGCGEPSILEEGCPEKIRKNVLFSEVLAGVLPKHKFYNNGEDESTVRLQKNECEKSNARQRNPGEDVGNPSPHWSQTTSPRRKWKAAVTSRVTGVGDFIQHLWSWCCRELRRGNPSTSRKRLSKLLQTGFSHTALRSWCRDRRILALRAVASGTGSEEGRPSTISRVDSVEIHKQTSDGTYGGVCRDGYVYNIEVAGLHTYTANGFVVHNCQHSVGDSYGKIFEHMGVKYRKDILNLGVTATTNRSDGQGLNKVYDKISKQYKIFDAMKDGWLSDLRCRKVCTTTNLDTVPRKGQDFDLIQLSKELDTPYRNDLVVRAYEEYGENRKFLGFAVDIKHAQHLAKRFQEAGHNVEAVWGDDPLRADKLRRHRAGDIHGLFNCAFLTEGYDDWTIQCIILARSTQSTPLLTQIIGRGLRIPDGCDNLKEAIRRGDTLAKTDCLILDIADVSTKHTLATVPNLFGLGDKVDMEGRSMLAVVPEVELIQAQKPYLDITNLDKIGDLYTYAEQVDMFRVEAPPEIIQLSEFRWMKHGNDSYYLSLKDGEYLFVLSDMLGKWTLSGKCNGNTVVRQRETLEDAIKEGDYVVRMLGGRVFENMARRVTKTGMRPPSKAQLDLLRKLGLRPPPGMKSDEIRNMISKRLLELNYRKKNNR